MGWNQVAKHMKNKLPEVEICRSPASSKWLLTITFFLGGHFTPAKGRRIKQPKKTGHNRKNLAFLGFFGWKALLQQWVQKIVLWANEKNPGLVGL